MPANCAPRWAMTCPTDGYGTASTAMSPVTSLSASELLMSSTVLPPLPARPAMG